jgi:signal transduction histidine kinase/CheY-like chemotaxis protein
MHQAARTSSFSREEPAPTDPAPIAGPRSPAALELLAELGLLVARASGDSRMTMQLLAGACIRTFADSCAVYVRDGETFQVHEHAIAHVEPDKVQIIRALYERWPLASDSPYGFPAVLRTGRTQLVARFSDEQRDAAARDVEHLRLLTELGSRSWIVTPLRRGEGATPFGAVTFTRADAKPPFDDADVVLAEEIALRAALAIDHARLFEQLSSSEEQLRKANRRAAHLQRLASDLVSIGSLQDLARLFRQAERAAPLEAHGCLLYVREGDSIHCIADNASTEEGGQLPEGSLVSADHPLSRLFRNGEPLWMRDGAECAALLSPASFARGALGAEVCAQAAIALSAGNRVIAAFAVSFREARTFDAGERAYLTAIADLWGQALHRARLAEAERAALARAHDAAQRLEAAQRIGGIGIFDWDIRAGRVYWSPDLYRLLGLEPGSIDATPEAWLKSLPDTDRESSLAAWSEVVEARREHLEIELRLRQPSGETRWVRSTSRVSYDGAEPVRLLGAVVDIEALKQTTEAREAERRRLLALLEQVPAAVTFLRGPDLVVEFAHPIAIASVGGRDIVGKPLLVAIPELRGHHYERLRRVYETGKADTSHELATSVEVRGRRVEQYWDSVLLPVRDPSGRVEGVMTFDLEITRGVVARRELEAASRAKDEFLATMSHELRTPLTAILGWAAILRNSPRDAERLERGLGVIERNARAQERLVSDLLDVSRIITGKLQLKLQLTEISAVVFAAADVVRPAAEAKGTRLVVDLDPNVGAVVGDADRLQQVVWNLLSNAVRFTPRGGRISVGADRTSAGVRIRVEDTGVGIPRDQLDRVFERFRQVDSSTTRRHGGLGLGLAIVRHLVEAHGGHVEAQSEGPELGATFTVHLPIHAVDTSQKARAADGVQPDVTRQSPGSEVDLGGVRVLVVEDDADSRELLCTVLGDAGAAVRTANSAEEALAAPGPIDVIVSDIAMPDEDGYSFLRRLRSRGEAGDIPAIALTAYSRPEDAERAWRAGFQEHLTKPIDAGRLLTTVKLWARPAVP